MVDNIPDYNYKWSSSTCSSTPPTNNWYRNSRVKYYKDYYSNFKTELYESVAIKKVDKVIKEYVDGDILNSFKRDYIYGKEVIIDPLKVVMFDPKNLWSEPKCLITDTVQSAKQK